MAHINIDKWMDKHSPRYNPEIASAIFHYSARADRGERFEACIVTQEMKEAAWRHADRSQILLDGTFGVSTKKLLLFILMGLDKKRCGEPLALFIFSQGGRGMLKNDQGSFFLGTASGYYLPTYHYVIK